MPVLLRQASVVSFILSERDYDDPHVADGKAGTERLSHLPKITQLEDARGSSKSQTICSNPRGRNQTHHPQGLICLPWPGSTGPLPMREVRYRIDFTDVCSCQGRTPCLTRKQGERQKREPAYSECGPGCSTITDTAWALGGNTKSRPHPSTTESEPAF